MAPMRRRSIRRGWLAAVLLAALGCAVREPRLVWEAGGAPTARTLAELDRLIVPAGPGLRAAAFGDAPEATFRVLEITEAERPHVHDRHDLTIVLLRGRGVLYVEERRHALRAGDVAHIGRGTSHHFHPRGAVIGLAVYTPRLKGRDHRDVGP
jgi:mannose-6-phosphate isomerase-like protein (cupin superfamily)